MTIAPVPPSPGTALPGTVPGLPGGTGPGAAGFAALVAAFLVPGAGTPVALPLPVAPAPAGPQAEPGAEVGEEPRETDGEESTGAPVVLGGPAVPLPVVLPAPVAAAGHADVPSATAPVPGVPTTAEAPTSETTATTTPTDRPALPESAAPTQAAQTTQTQPSAVTATAPAPVATPTAPTAPVTPGAEAARPAPVATQLAPEVTRLVSRGDGVHRLTMKLQPEALGEVRVTLTVRQGEVHVRLAATESAQAALLEGAPELRRVLELAGASDARVVVRDLPGTTPAGTAGTPNPSYTPTPGGGGDHGDAHGPGQGHAGSPDQHARTRGGTTARDGLTDGVDTPRPDPAGRSLRGVDLTM